MKLDEVASVSVVTVPREGGGEGALDALPSDAEDDVEDVQDELD